DAINAQLPDDQLPGDHVSAALEQLAGVKRLVADLEGFEGGRGAAGEIKACRVAGGSEDVEGVLRGNSPGGLGEEAVMAIPADGERTAGRGAADHGESSPSRQVVL